MAGGMDLGTGGRGRRKPLDAAINLVPFIDLMAVTISFLIMTAVWPQLARLQVSQAGDAPPDPERKSLALSIVLSARGYSIDSDGAHVADLPKVSGAFDLRALSTELARFHAGYPDQRAITVRCDDSVKYADLVAAIDACVGQHLDAVSVAPAS